jgi:alanine racemase
MAALPQVTGSRAATVAPMTVRLTVERAAWHAHVHATAAAYGHPLVPVVKGNGYGFGRPVLHDAVAAAGAQIVAVGNVHELDDVPSSLQPVVLTPTLDLPSRQDAILTIGSGEHVDALQGWQGREGWNGSVMVKLASRMRRYGTSSEALPSLLQHVHSAGLTIHAYALHLPLVGTDDDRMIEVEGWIPHLPDDASLWLSHLEPSAVHALRIRHPRLDIRVRVGTRLWLGVPRGEFARLSADVLQVNPVREGEPVGYRGRPAPCDGFAVAIGAGVVNGVAPLDDVEPGRDSPFHFEHTRLALVERPHMHTSMVIVPGTQRCPSVGDRVDVQRPFITTAVDEIEWR